MNRASPRATSIEPQIARAGIRGKKIISISAAVMATVLVIYILLASVFPPLVKISPGDGSQDVPAGSPLKISASRMRGNINNVSVTETDLDPLGNPTGSRVIDGRLENGVFISNDGGDLIKPDSRYDVTVDASLTEFTATGPKHRNVTESASFKTVITPAPIFLKNTQTVPMGEPIVVEFNTPISSFTYDIAPQLKTGMRIDVDNPTRAYISFDGYQQGEKFQLTITGAQAQNGATLKHLFSQTVATTDPLKVVFVPGDGESAVSLSSRPSLTFSEEIANKEQLESLVSIEPHTVGGWDWIDDKTAEFKPLKDWEKGQQVTLHLKGGPDGLRSKGGSFLREDVQSSFTTKPSKLIDVNLTTQTLTLYENDVAQKSFLVSTGSQATPSLTGTYAIYHKAEKVDMRGDGYFAPNVPWVLMFNGDYTIHGNYWATRFGVPTSHGCVGLPLPDAEYVYNWTPIGTIVSIHN